MKIIDLFVFTFTDCGYKLSCTFNLIPLLFLPAAGYTFTGVWSFVCTSSKSYLESFRK